ncbi:MAG: hypothetical protein H6897_04370 [Rhodobacteraceae bacterium]|jgi:hypothetical protein|uniref:hypothetical protein n=1 Tax=Albidovulum sp. TaxID=1872424 RepID=UPI001D219188|nr:hypothetical protein [uncultured Defluviimonas sp.]MCB2125837.1 hypothetical protein [Paracoccaceae bacterium]MCC0069145.1 hypothetical protein [Paracoccaceae bacterium]
MTSLSAPFRVTEILLHGIFRRHPAPAPDDPRAIKRRARIDLAHLPEYLKRDIGLFDD